LPRGTATLRLPNLETLLLRLTLADTDTQDESTRSPPHERALAQALGIAAADGCIPWAAFEARQLGIAAQDDTEGWGVVTLCNWQVGIDDVALGDPSAIEIDAAESAALLAVARPFFEEDGIALHPSPVPGRWLARARIFDGLATASIDRAVGYPISQWSPLADAARSLRRLQNEMQMLLYTERVNDDRAARGVPPINSFWLSGTGALKAAPPVGGHRRARPDGRAPRPAPRPSERRLARGLPARRRRRLGRGLAGAGRRPRRLAAVRLHTRRRRGAHAVRRPRRAALHRAAARPGALGPKPVRAQARRRGAGVAMKIVARDIPPRTVWALEQAGVHPLLARLFAARGVRAKDELDDGLALLLAPDTLRGTRDAAVLLADAIAQDRRLCIVADYDCDGATACAVGVRGLRLLGAKHVAYLVPDRVVDGYGLTPPIAERVADSGADMLITVDNGIASVDGVAAAKARGLQVLVTDHHLPGPELPLADVLVNPNQPGCEFESKSIAGVGVMFYVLLALRSELRRRGVFDVATQPKLDALCRWWRWAPWPTW
jgi:hypothetical protein